MIRSVVAGDASRIADIYNYYVSETTISFEEDLVSADEMKQRIADAAAAELPWLVAENDKEIVGYAYASRWKGRCAYRFAVEVTVYMSNDLRSRGWGRALYRSLFAKLKENSIHVIMAGIALPNPASVALHESFGMKKVAHFEEVGCKFDRWVDVGYWQCKTTDIE